ncbi:MAG: hypothetical protein RQ733_07030 [Methyloprofundus sp.]|nr:hypothetical protein [Methyloprofundus sp.]MDT8425711.1 hypothetical protein [Methyloprofundus sp.]
MNLLFCRFIILFLLLLQGFTPLVHAHVQIIDDMANGIHIDELSRAWHDTDTALSLSANDYAGTAIDMHAAIAQKKLLLDGELENSLFFAAQLKLTRLFVIINNTSAFADVFIVKPPASLSAIAPRAPPSL